MDHTDAYVDILVTSLRKKVTLLEKIEKVITDQERELKKPDPDIDHLDEIEKQIGELLQEVEQSEDGFESVYNRVKDSMGDNKDKYKSQIQEMQGYIKKITDKTVKIKAQEVRNQQYMKLFFENKKREIRQFRSGNRSVARYSQHTANSAMGQSYFLNKKK
jgi:DNA repair ATPase RecN